VLNAKFPLNKLPSLNSDPNIIIARWQYFDNYCIRQYFKYISASITYKLSLNEMFHIWEDLQIPVLKFLWRFLAKIFTTVDDLQVDKLK